MAPKSGGRLPFLLSAACATLCLAAMPTTIAAQGRERSLQELSRDVEEVREAQISVVDNWRDSNAVMLARLSTLRSDVRSQIQEEIDRVSEKSNAIVNTLLGVMGLLFSVLPHKVSFLLPQRALLGCSVRY